MHKHFPSYFNFKAPVWADVGNVVCRGPLARCRSGAWVLLIEAQPLDGVWPVFLELGCLGMQPKAGGKLHLKAGTYSNRWTSEAFGEARTRSGAARTLSAPINMRSLRRLAVRAILFSDWQCASKSARCVGGVEYCVRLAFTCTPFRHFLFSCFGVPARD